MTLTQLIQFNFKFNFNFSFNFSFGKYATDGVCRLVAITALFWVIFTQTPHSSAFTCTELFKPELNARERWREDQYEATLKANFMFPQVNSGISLAIISHYLLNPMPIEDLVRPATTAEVAKTADKMNRVHAAFSVRRATADFLTQEPVETVTLARVAEVLNMEKETAYDALIKALNILFPWERIRIPKQENGREYQKVPITGAHLFRINRFLLELDEEGAIRLRKFGQVISEVLKSQAARDLSIEYRNSIKAIQSEKHGETYDGPPATIDSLQVNSKLYSLLQSRLQQEFPDIPDYKWRFWYNKAFVFY